MSRKRGRHRKDPGLKTAGLESKITLGTVSATHCPCPLCFSHTQTAPALQNLGLKSRGDESQGQGTQLALGARLGMWNWDLVLAGELIPTIPTCPLLCEQSSARPGALTREIWGQSNGCHPEEQQGVCHGGRWVWDGTETLPCQGRRLVREQSQALHHRAMGEPGGTSRNASHQEEKQQDLLPGVWKSPRSIKEGAGGAPELTLLHPGTSRVLEPAHQQPQFCKSQQTPAPSPQLLLLWVQPESQDLMENSVDRGCQL